MPLSSPLYQLSNAKSSSGGDGKNFYPVTSSLSGYGKLTEKDTTVSTSTSLQSSLPEITSYFIQPARADVTSRTVDVREQQGVPDRDAGVVHNPARWVLGDGPDHLVVPRVSTLLTYETQPYVLLHDRRVGLSASPSARPPPTTRVHVPG